MHELKKKKYCNNSFFSLYRGYLFLHKIQPALDNPGDYFIHTSGF